MQIAGKEIDPHLTTEQLVLQIKALPSAFEERIKLAAIPAEVSLFDSKPSAQEHFEAAEFAYGVGQANDDSALLQNAAEHYESARKALEIDPNTLNNQETDRNLLLAYGRCLTKYGQIKLSLGEFKPAEEALNAAVKVYFPDKDTLHNIKDCTKFLEETQENLLLHAHLSDAAGYLYQATLGLANEYETAGQKEAGNALRIGDKTLTDSPDSHIGLRYIRGYLTLLHKLSRLQTYSDRDEPAAMVEQGEYGVSTGRAIKTQGNFSCIGIAVRENPENKGDICETFFTHMDDRNNLDALEEMIERNSGNDAPLKLRLFGARTSVNLPVAMENMGKFVKFLKDKKVDIISSDILEKDQATSYTIYPEDFSVREGVKTPYSMEDALVRVIRVLQQEGELTDLFGAFDNWRDDMGAMRIVPQSVQDKLKIFYEDDVPSSLADFQDKVELYAQRVYDWMENSGNRHPLWRAPILVNEVLGAMYAQQAFVSHILEFGLGEELLDKLQTNKGITEEQARLELGKLTLDFPVVIDRKDIDVARKLVPAVKQILVDALDKPDLDINQLRQFIQELREPAALWQSNLRNLLPGSSWAARPLRPEADGTEPAIFGEYDPNPYQMKRTPSYVPNSRSPRLYSFADFEDAGSGTGDGPYDPRLPDTEDTPAVMRYVKSRELAGSRGR